MHTAPMPTSRALRVPSGNASGRSFYNRFGAGEMRIYAGATLQKPIGSGFNATSTAGDVIKGVDLSGKIAIVTGGYSGLGRETARVLRSAGAKVIGRVR